MAYRRGVRWVETSHSYEASSGNQDQQAQQHTIPSHPTNDNTVAPQDLMLHHGHDQHLSSQPLLPAQRDSVLSTGLYDGSIAMSSQQNAHYAGQEHRSRPAFLPCQESYDSSAQLHTQHASQPYQDDHNISGTVPDSAMPTPRPKGKEHKLDPPSPQPEYPNYDDQRPLQFFQSGALPPVANDPRYHLPELPRYDNQLPPIQEGWEAYANQPDYDDNMLHEAMIAGGYVSPTHGMPDVATVQFQTSDVDTDVSPQPHMAGGFHALIEDGAPPSLPPRRPANTPAQHPTKQIWMPVDVPLSFDNDVRLELSNTNRHTALDNTANSLSPDSNLCVYAVMHHYEDLACPSVLSENGKDMGVSANLSTLINLHASDKQARRSAWTYISGRMARRGIKMSASAINAVSGNRRVPVYDRFVISVRQPPNVQGGQGKLVQRDIVWVQKVSFADGSS